MIDIDTLRTILDSMAAGVLLFDVVLGEGTPGSVSGAADANVAMLAAVDDVDVQQHLTGAFVARAAIVRATAQHRALGGFTVLRALDRHVGGTYGSLSAFLRTNNTRVHERLSMIGFALDADVVFAGTSVELAQWTAAGFVDGGAVNTTQHADAPIEIEATVKGPTDATLTLTLRDHTGAEEVFPVWIPGTFTGAQTLMDGEGGQPRYSDCIGLAKDGGDAEDRITVRTKVERNVVL